MKRLGTLLKKDIRLGISDIFIILEIVFAVFFSVILVFVIPEDIRTSGKVYIHDETGLIEDFITKAVPDVGKKLGEYYVDSRDEVVDGMIKDKSAVGVLIKEEDDGSFDVELLTQPYTKKGVIDYINVDIEDLMSIITPPAGRYPPDVYGAVRIEANYRENHELLAFNKRMLPPFLVMNVGLIGLFAMVSLIGQERADMTIRAYRLSPASLPLFITSKHIMILLVSIATFSILYLPLMGTGGYLKSLAVMLLTVAVMSSIGIILASFYKTPMEAIGWVFILMLVLALPAISILNPVFTPDWLKLVPSFYTFFGIDAAMFPGHKEEIYRSSIIIISLMAAVTVPLSAWIFSRKIGKEA